MAAWTWTVFLSMSNYKTLLCTTLLILLTHAGLQAQEGDEELPGYELRSNQVLIETPEHWRGWEAPTGARLIQPDGTVLPRLLRSNINAVVNAETDSIIARITNAGTNREDAELVLDGDLQTYWEPDRDDPLNSWHIKIDLGRTVIAERIRLRFAEEGEGDPFLKFRVLISDGLPAFGRNSQFQFSRVGLISNLNSQREFVFEVTPQKKVAEGITGAITQVVRIDVLDSDGPRAEEVSFEVYQRLSAENQGGTDYFLRTVSGRQIAVSQDTYEALPAEERGPIRYYRQERPRLAEVEVQAIGENIIAITQAEQEREALQLGKFDFLLFRTFTDGMFSSVREMQIYDPVQDENQVEIDLGAKYWLDRIKLLSPDRPPFAYQVRISNGSMDPNGNLVWTNFEERRNLERLLHVEERFRHQEVRYIEVRQLEFSGSFREKGRLSEIQAFGQGYVSEIAMTSPFIRLGRPRLFSHITWDGEAPPNTRIEVRTRTGDKVTLLPHYFTMNGREISEALWNRLPDTEQTPRPPPRFEEITGPDWSNWSEVYTESGDAFKSPTPKPLARVQVRLLSREPLQRAWIRSLRMHFVPPLVDVVVGEVAPASGVEPGVEREFTLYLKPLFGSGNPGFDQLLLRSSTSAPLELLSVEAGSDAALRLNRGRQLWPGELQVARGEEGAVELTFPEPVARGQEVYAFRFRTKVFLQSTIFTARLSSSSRPGLSQVANSGDATVLTGSQSMVVVSRLQDSSLLEDVAVVPPVFTPNGDGINDETTVEVAVFHLENAKRLHVEVFDLAGRRVRDLSVERAHPSGEHRLAWDGRDDSGRRPPPGIYVVHVYFDTDSGAKGTRVIRLVHLAY